VTAIGGASDPVVPLAALSRWEEVTDGPFDVHVLPGGHFYFNQQMRAFTAIVNGVLDRAGSRHEYA
jgi:surfactin synthase thioesterase subunit